MPDGHFATHGVLLVLCLIAIGCNSDAAKLDRHYNEAAALLDGKAPNIKAAIGILDRQLAEAPDHPRVLLLRAEAKFRARDYSGSLVDLLRLKELGEDSSRIKHLRANVMQHASQHQEAVKELNELLQSEDADKGSGDIRRDLSTSHYMLAQYDAALATLKHQSIARDADYYLLLGRIYVAQENFPEAEKSFTKAISTSPESNEAFSERALVRRALGNDLLAIEDEQMASAIAPDGAKNKKLRDLVREFRGDVAAGRTLLGK